MLITEIIVICITLWASYAPRISGQDDYEYHCSVIDNQTICDAQYQYFDIKREFERLSEMLDENEKVMRVLEIYNSSIDIIPENAFSDIAFNSIKIFGAQDLSLISTNAFSDKMSAHLVNQLMIASPSNLISSPPDYDLYKALQSLSNIAYIQITLRDIHFHEIPENAFKETQNNLKYLVFDSSANGYGISRLGANSFVGLNNLVALSLRRIFIQEIASNAFNFNTESEERLTINLEDCLIFDDNLGNDTFSGAKRPLTVNLALNSVQYLREEIFGFLKENNQNVLKVYGNPMNCDDINPFLWILINKVVYQKQIWGAACANGTSLWDLVVDVPDPTTSPTTSNTASVTVTNVTLSVTFTSPGFEQTTPSHSTPIESSALSTSFSLILMILFKNK